MTSFMALFPYLASKLHAGRKSKKSTLHLTFHKVTKSKIIEPMMAKKIKCQLFNWSFPRVTACKRLQKWRKSGSQA